MASNLCLTFRILVEELNEKLASISEGNKTKDGERKEISTTWKEHERGIEY